MQQSNQNMENKNNDLTEIITQVLNEMKMELGDSFDIDKVNLAELERRTGITRAKLRRIKSNGFVDTPHGLTGRKAEYTVLSGYTAVIDNLLGKSITNASLIHERIRELGYSGGLTSIKDYIAQHRYLIPAKQVDKYENRILDLIKKDVDLQKYILQTYFSDLDAYSA